MLTTALRTTALAALVGLAAAAPAAADSLVYVKDHNVWLANPDGSGQYQVTTDGTANNPYQSPSQSDDGVIVTMRAKPNGAPLLRLRQNGELLGTIPVGAVQAGPTDPHVSPDGRHVAFGIVRAAYVNGWLELTTDVRTVRVADGAEVGQTGSRANTPSWLDNANVLTATGPVAEWDPITTASYGWWSDYDHYSTFGHGEDLRDGEAAPGRVVFVRGEGEGKTMQVYRAPRGTAEKPQPTCTFSDPADGPLGRRYVDPTFSPNGQRMAWQEGNGIWTVAHPDVNDCNIEPKLTIPGASEPDWSPAPHAPGPRPTTEAPKGGGSTAGGGQTGNPIPAAPRATVNVTSASRAKGVTLKLSGAAPGKASAQLKLGKRTLARGKTTVGASGAATLRVTLSAKSRRTVKPRAKATIVVSLPGGTKQTLNLRLR